MRHILPVTFICAIALIASAQQTDHSQHAKEAKSEKHYEDVNKRGEAHEGMGFSQTATTHHFFLTNDGGVIQVTANDSADKQSIAMVQRHFQHIGMAFADGNFEIPHFVHDTSVPGVQTMKRLKDQITYTPENLENGARLKIETKSAEALQAIHRFLRFQIADHRTGDSGKVQEASK